VFAVPRSTAMSRAPRPGMNESMLILRFPPAAPTRSGRALLAARRRGRGRRGFRGRPRRAGLGGGLRPAIARGGLRPVIVVGGRRPAIAGHGLEPAEPAGRDRRLGRAVVLV